MSAALQEEFKRIDSGNDGKIDWRELASGCNVPDVEARSLVEFFDYDEDGGLNFAEFVTMQKVRANASLPALSPASRQPWRCPLPAGLHEAGQ